MKKGITHIYDILDQHGEILPRNVLENTFDIQINYIDYHGFSQAIEPYKKLSNIIYDGNIHLLPSIPKNIALLLRDKKGCQNIYGILTSNNHEPTSKLKWLTTINTAPGLLKWNNIYHTPYICTKDTNLRWFQFKLTHRILATNVFLHKINIAENDLCTLCNMQNETICHLFGECHIVKHFWNEFKTWYNTQLANRQINLDISDILSGTQTLKGKNIALNFMILLAKYFIYITKCNKEMLTITKYKRVLEFWFNAEKYNANMECN